MDPRRNVKGVAEPPPVSTLTPTWSANSHRRLLVYRLFSIELNNYAFPYVLFDIQHLLVHDLVPIVLGLAIEHNQLKHWLI